MPTTLLPSTLRGLGCALLWGVAEAFALARSRVAARLHRAR